MSDCRQVVPRRLRTVQPLHPLACAVVAVLACALPMQVQARRSEYVLSLVEQLHKLQAEHPEVIEANLQKVKDTMPQASLARKQEAIRDDARLNAT